MGKQLFRKIRLSCSRLYNGLFKGLCKGLCNRRGHDVTFFQSSESRTRGRADGRGGGRSLRLVPVQGTAAGGRGATAGAAGVGDGRRPGAGQGVVKGSIDEAKDDADEAKSTAKDRKPPKRQAAVGRRGVVIELRVGQHDALSAR